MDPGKEAARRAWVPALTHVSHVRPRAALAWAVLACRAGLPRARVRPPWELRAPG